MNQFFIPRPFSKPPKAMEVLTILELQDETRLIVFNALFLKKPKDSHISITMKIEHTVILPDQTFKK